jgi:hypothetical protein
MTVVIMVYFHRKISQLFFIFLGVFYGNLQQAVRSAGFDKLSLLGFVWLDYDRGIDNDDALIQAKRSIRHGEPTIDNLQIWNGEKYVKVV